MEKTAGKGALWDVSWKWATKQINCTGPAIAKGCRGPCCRGTVFYPPKASEGGCCFLKDNKCKLSLKERPVRCLLYPFLVKNKTLVLHGRALLSHCKKNYERAGPTIFEHLRSNLVELFGAEQYNRMYQELVIEHTNSWVRVPEEILEAIEREEKLEAQNAKPERRNHMAKKKKKDKKKVEELKVEYIKISELKPFADNPRRNKDAIEPVRRSIEEFGFNNPILTDKDLRVCCGHTRIEAAKRAGLKEVPIIRLSLDETKFRGFNIADNQTAAFSLWEETLLSKGVQLLEEGGLNLEVLGFDVDFLDTLRDGTFDGPGEPGKGVNLQDAFIIPPFTVLDTRRGLWQERKRAWNGLIKDRGETRQDTGMARPQVKYPSLYRKYSKTNKSVSFVDYLAKLPPKTLEKEGEKVSSYGVSILDPVLAELAVKWFGFEGCSTFDPFAGDSVFGYVSGFLKCPFTGIELRAEQAEVNNRRVREAGLEANYHCDDGQNVLKHIEPESMDLLFSCPPYFDLEVYSDLENDASNQGEYEDFLKIMDKALSDSIKCLKENRFAVIVYSDMRDKKTRWYRQSPSHLMDIFKRNGMELYNELIIVNPIHTGALRAANNFKFRLITRTHQEVLVFFKGKRDAIPEHFTETIKVEDIQGEYDSQSGDSGNEGDG